MSELVTALRRSADPADQEVAGLLAALAAEPRPVPRASEALAAVIAAGATRGAATAPVAGARPMPEAEVVLHPPTHEAELGHRLPWWRTAVTGLLAVSSAGVLGAVLLASYDPQDDQVVVRPGGSDVRPSPAVPLDLPPSRPAPDEAAPDADGPSAPSQQSRRHPAGTSDGTRSTGPGTTAPGRGQAAGAGSADRDDAGEDDAGSGSVAGGSGDDDSPVEDGSVVPEDDPDPSTPATTDPGGDGSDQTPYDGGSAGSGASDDGTPDSSSVDGGGTAED